MAATLGLLLLWPVLFQLRCHVRFSLCASRYFGLWTVPHGQRKALPRTSYSLTLSPASSLTAGRAASLCPFSLNTFNWFWLCVRRRCQRCTLIIVNMRRYQFKDQPLAYLRANLPTHPPTYPCTYFLASPTISPLTFARACLSKSLQPHVRCEMWGP